MAPRVPAHDVRHHTRDNAKFSSDRLLERSGLALFSNPPDVLRGQLGVPVSFSARPAALAHHVGYVVLRGPDEQVIWAHAGRVVAVMATIQSRRNRAVMQFIGNTVRKSVGVRTTCGYKDRQGTVTATGAQAVPQPTPVGLVHVSPEPILGRGWRSVWPRSVDVCKHTPTTSGKAAREFTCENDRRVTADTLTEPFSNAWSSDHANRRQPFESLSGQV